MSTAAVAGNLTEFRVALPISGPPRAGASASSQSRSTATAQRLKPKPMMGLSIHEYLQLLLLLLLLLLQLLLLVAPGNLLPCSKGLAHCIKITRQVDKRYQKRSSPSPYFKQPRIALFYRNQQASATNVKTTAAAAASRQQLKSYLMLQSPAHRPLSTPYPSHTTLFPTRLSPFFAFVAAVGNHGKLSSVGIS